MSSHLEIQACVPLLQQGRWFAAVSPEFREALLHAAKIRHLAGGERLFARGDAADGVYCVIEGALRISGLAASGKEALLMFLEPPNWFGEIALFDGGLRTHDAWAVDACSLLQIPQTALTKILQHHPDYWRELGLLLAEKLRLAFVALESLALMPAPQRLAQRLLMIAEGYGTSQGRALIRLPQDQLAAMVSLSRQTTNQILRDLAAQGVVRLQRGGIEIVDLAALRACATADY